ncbi:MAG: zf-HC2 domain-containing protein [Acidobacteria bacterium]|nr:zf-HC2 domain-containing protein [Acidobacteriota bacterium]
MNCTCAEFEILLCDAVDQKLRGDGRVMFEAHRASCPACNELAADVLGATAFMERVAGVEPPKELLTRILFETAGKPGKSAAAAKGWWRGLLGPILQPKLAMGLTMTVLSISMIAQVFGIELRQMRAADLQPARIVAGVEDGMYRGWSRVVKYYENIRVVYEIQSRLKEWADQEELDRQAKQAQPPKQQNASPSGR